MSPIVATDDLPAGLREHLRLDRSGIFDALVLARQFGMLLVTDDLPTREVDRALGGNGGAWLHVVFNVALDLQHINFDQYVCWSANLINAGHNYLGVSGAVLAHAARLDAAAERAPGYLFVNLSQMIGGRAAEPVSHIEAAIGCLRELWDDHHSAGFRGPVTSHLLRRLVHEREDDYTIILRMLLASTREVPRLAGYIRDWLRGHFLLQSVLGRKS